MVNPNEILEECKDGFDDLNELIANERREAAKAAREQVLDELFKDGVKQGGRTDGFEFYIIGVKTVESLRAQQEEERG